MLEFSRAVDKWEISLAKLRTEERNDKEFQTQRSVEVKIVTEST